MNPVAGQSTACRVGGVIADCHIFTQAQEGTERRSCIAGKRVAGQIRFTLFIEIDPLQ